VRKPRKSTEVVYYVPGFHCDAVWLEDQREYAGTLLSDMRQNLEICRIDPSYGAYFHELSYVKPYFDTHPAERDFLRELVAAGRVGTGGSYNEPTETVIGPEAIVRNILYGRLFHEGVLGDDPRVYTPWDVFGHIPQLSQILAKSRFDGTIWSKYIRGFPPTFWHQALDGTRLLHHRKDYGLTTISLQQLMERVEERSWEMREAGSSAMLFLDCSDFKPPTAWLAGMCGELKRQKPRVEVTGQGHTRFLHHLLKEVRDEGLQLPVTARDPEYYHQGTRLSRVEFKLANRRAESAVLAAEKFGTIANLLGAHYPDKALDKAWRHLLFNSHHDGVAGPCCDRVYLDMMNSFREAIELGREARDGALDFISGGIDTSGAPSPEAVPLAVFNSLNWDRTDVCAVELPKPTRGGYRLQTAAGETVASEVRAVHGETGEIVFVAAGVPSLGYRLYYAIPDPGATFTAAAPAISMAGAVIENEFFRLEADPKLGGGLRSIYDKQAKRELLDVSRGPGNEIVALAEKPDRNEPSWEIYTTGEKTFSRQFPATVEVAVGPVASRLIVRGGMKDCGRQQEVVLYRGVRRIEFVTQLEKYAGLQDLLVVTFPSALQGLAPVYDERYGVITGKQSKGYLDFQMSQWQNFSDHGLRAVHQWFGQSWCGRLCFTRAGKVVARHALGMIGLHGPVSGETRPAAYRLQEHLIKKGLPVTPFEDVPDRPRERGEHAYSTLYDDLDEDLKWGTSFRISLDIAGKNRYSKRVLRQVDRQKLAAFEQRRKRDGFAFLFAADRKVPAGWPALRVLIVSAADEAALERAIDRLLDGFDETATMTLPVEVEASDLPGKLDDYTFAMLNRGHQLGSVERDGAVVSCLMQTAHWSRAHLPFVLWPEHKCHVFTYALHLGDGDWRKTGAVRAGCEYNEPLRAVATGRHRGELPAQWSFLRVEPETVIVTALKPQGNPTAALSKATQEAGRALIVRAYESTGRPAAARFTFPYPVAAAHRTNLLEEREAALAPEGSSVPLTINPFSIETVEVNLQAPRPTRHARRLAREVEPIQPIHMRFWQHNTHEGPLGYSPVTVTLTGKVDTLRSKGRVTVNTLQLGVVNDYVDRRVTGHVDLIGPADWKFEPAQVDYALEPGGQMTRDVLVCFIGPARRGIIKARMEHDGQVYQDVIEVGDPHTLTMTAARSASAITVTVENPGEDDIEAVLNLITPIECWPARETDDLTRLEITPRSQGLVAPAGGKVRCRFDLALRADTGPTYWAIARLDYLGRVDYLTVPGSTTGLEPRE
jgi:alpha-mannosidase